MNEDAQLVLGFMLGAVLLPVLTAIARAMIVAVEEGEAVLVSRFGRLAATLDRPGLHLVPDRLLPWASVKRVSRRRAHRVIRDVVVNDVRGTTVTVDVFLEFRVEDPVKATFAVEDWERALTNVVSHAVISILGSREFSQILCDRAELRSRLEKEIAEETERWGLRIERVLLRDVRLLPEVSHHILRSVAARLERWKADIEEDGRQRAAMLEAETSADVASLVAEARAQYPLAVGRALAQLKARPQVCAAYEELYELSLLHPNRTVAFVGFDDLRADVAAMLAPVEGGGALDPRRLPAG